MKLFTLIKPVKRKILKNRNILVYIIIFIILLFFVFLFININKKKNFINLTDRELEWIEKHPEICIAFDGEYAPYSFKTKQGNFQGIAVDFTDEVIKRAGLKMKVYPEGTWKKIYQAGQQKDVDVVATLVMRPERRKWFEFTSPYISLAQYIITRKGNKIIDSREKIRGRRVALVKSYSTTKYILEEFPGIAPVYVDNISSALLAVSTEKADATVAGMGIAQHLIASQGISNLRFAALYAQGLSEQRFGVRKDWPELAGILDKALLSIPADKRLKIFQRWSYPEIAKIETVLPIQNSFQLNDNEKKWLAKHSVINIGFDPMFAPFEFVDADGRYSGIAADYVKIIEKKLKIKFKPVMKYTWKKVIISAREKKIDVLPCLGITNERKKFFHFSLPYLSFPRVIITRKESKINSLEGLSGIRFGVQENSSHHGYIKEETILKPILYNTFQDAMQALSQKRIEAVIGNLATATYTIQSLSLTNLKIAAHTSSKTFPLAFAVKKEYCPLVEIINKVLESIPDNERLRILHKWIPVQYAAGFLPESDKINLTRQQLKWLKNHPVVNVGINPKWPPIDYLDDNARFKGMSIDILNILAKRLQIKFRPVKRDTWQESLDAIKGGDVDLLSSITYTSSRAKYLSFTRPYLSLPLMIFTLDNHPYINKLSDLNEGVTVIIKGHAIGEFLERDYPGIKILRVDNVEEALRALVSGKAHHYIEVLLVASYNIEKLGYSGIKIAGEIPYKYKFSLAVRKDWPLFREILEKGIASISEEEWNLISKKWRSIQYKHGFDYSLLWKFGLPLIGLLFFFGIWNWQLKRIVARRTRELKLSEQQYRQLFNNSNDAIFLYALNEKGKPGKFVEINDIACQRLGYTHDELQNLSPWDIEHFEFNYKRYAVFQSLKKKQHTLYEIEHISKNGNYIPVEINARLFEMAGQPMVLAIVRDITERRNIDKQLHRDIERARILLDLYLKAPELSDKELYKYALDKAVFLTGSLIGFFHIIADDQKTIILTSWNNEALKNCTAAYDTHYPLEQAGNWVDCIRERKPVVYNDFPKSPNQKGLPEGHTPITRFMSIPVMEDDKIRYIFGVGNKADDYTEHDVVQLQLIANELGRIIKQRRIENKIKVSEERLSLATRSAGIGIWDWDIKDNQLIWDDRMYELYGVTRNEYPDAYQAWENGLHGSDIKKYEEAIQMALKGEQDFHVECRVLWPGKDIHYIEAYANVIYDEGNIPIRMIGVSWDITERKKVEEELKLNQDKLEERVKERTKELKRAREIAEGATKAKSDFLANMSHEIRTPMNAIIGMSYLLQKTKLIRKQKDYVNKIHSSAQGLLGIINDILDFSKIEAGKLEVESIEFSLAEVLDNFSSIISLKAEEKGLEFVIASTSNVPEILIGDPLRLGQVLLNLSNNAIKFTDQGEVVVSIDVVELRQNRVLLKFIVRDTGIGMKKEQTGKLFQSFMQADTSTTRKYGGTGLGLSICKKLVEIMGGEIKVDSKYGEGSTFTFTAFFGISRKKKEFIIPKKLRGLNVLIVDDNETARNVLSGYIKDFSFSSTSVSSGKEAISRIKKAQKSGKNNFDLILMDYKMPGLNGADTAELIFNDNRIMPKPKIIMITGYGREDVIKNIERLDISGILLKPITTSLLFDSIITAYDYEIESGRRWGKTKLEDSADLSAIRGASILVVEDNSINQQVARELLENEGFIVDLADNGQSALECISNKNNQESYNLVLMDLQMPVMDGYEATHVIRKNKRLNKIPIIAMTADAMRGVRSKVIKAGMDDYISKPINVTELFRALLKWIKPADISQVKKSAKAKKQVMINLPDQVPGLDIKDGLKRIGNNKFVYLQILKDFYNTFKGIAGQVKQLLADDNIDRARELTHTLKGVAGNIGAKSVQYTADEINESLVKPDKDKATINLQQLDKNIQDLFEAFNALGFVKEGEWIFKMDEKTYDFFPEDLFNEKINNIRQLLEAYDPEVNEFFQEVKEQFIVRFTIQGVSLAKYIENYDFDKALSLLDKIMEEVDNNG